MQAALELSNPCRQVFILLVELVELAAFVRGPFVNRRFHGRRLLPRAADARTYPEKDRDKERSFQSLAHGDLEDRREPTPGESKKGRLRWR